MRYTGIGPMDWMTESVCADYPTHWWTDTDMTRHAHMWRTTENRIAVNICNQCPVKRECLELSLTTEGTTGLPHRWGIYAGFTPAERQKLVLQHAV